MSECGSCRKKIGDDEDRIEISLCMECEGMAPVYRVHPKCETCKNLEKMTIFGEERLFCGILSDLEFDEEDIESFYCAYHKERE